MTATIIGPNSCYIETGKGKESVEVDGIKVTFTDIIDLQCQIG